ncbi:Calcium-binding protein NCS-1, partial [Friedmanniomyces endolithicus]
MDAPEDGRKIHDIYPDPPIQDGNDEDQLNPNEQASQQHERPNPFSGSINLARARPLRIPRVASESYPAFHRKQVAALKIAITGLEQEIRSSTGISYFSLNGHKLTLHREGSQSKLSQQELQDLLKATHFDKKELQQWYK